MANPPRWVAQDPEHERQSLVCLWSPTKEPGVYFYQVILKKNRKPVRVMLRGRIRDFDLGFSIGGSHGGPG